MTQRDGLEAYRSRFNLKLSISRKVEREIISKETILWSFNENIIDPLLELGTHFIVEEGRRSAR
jgi:hypothetical protein